MIGGFIITGNEPKIVALRGLGPSLADFGLSDVLADPTLELHGSAGVLMQNNNWQDDPAQAAALTALGLALEDPNESGIVATLQPGAYTAILAGNNQTAGLGLVEIYDAAPAASSQLANISTRGFVRTGDNVMIGGFILGGPPQAESTAVALRGIGPSLSQSGLSNVLADPTLELRDNNGALLIANDDWQDDPFAAAQLTANGLAPEDPLESGIFATLPPGLFTAILTGKNGGVGLGLVEIYTGLQAPTLTVTNTADSGPGSLRQALADANSGDAIRFAPALNGQAIILQSELVVDQCVTISGPGPDQLAVQRSDPPSFSIFRVMDGGHTVIIEGLTIRGGDAGLDAGAAGGGIRNDGSILTINNCVVGPNTSFTSGGGIYNGFGARLTIINSVVSQNSVASGFNPLGGGIHNAVGGTLEIRNSTISDNHLHPEGVHPGTGGGIHSSGAMTITNSTVRGNFAGAGAGIGNFGPLTIVQSTISGNTVLSVMDLLASGGGICHVSNSVLTIVNSTISGNSARDRGAAIYNNGPLTIGSSTISDNETDGNAGSIDNEGSLQLESTLLKAGPSGATIVNGSGTVTSHGYNLSSDNGGGFLTGAGDQINTDPLLGPLQDNGGPTFTHELLTGSSALNTGDPNFAPPPLYDQRGPGYDRVVNGRIDIGSLEVQP